MESSGHRPFPELAYQERVEEEHRGPEIASADRDIDGGALVVEALLASWPENARRAGR